jgi:hypothetical protein
MNRKEFNTVYVHPIIGNDTTGKLENREYPFKTCTGALNSILMPNKVIFGHLKLLQLHGRMKHQYPHLYLSVSGIFN